MDSHRCEKCGRYIHSRHSRHREVHSRPSYGPPRGTKIYSNLKTNQDRPKVAHSRPKVAPGTVFEPTITEIVNLVGTPGVGDNLDVSLVTAKTEIAMIFAMKGYDLTDEQYKSFLEMSADSEQCCLKHFLKRELGY